MTTLRKAAEQALEALEQYTSVVSSTNDPNAWITVVDSGKPARDAIAVLREALAQREWVGLTDQEIENLWNQHESRFDYYSFSCDIEAKLKEKNT